jgi:hypothetical protein
MIALVTANGSDGKSAESLFETGSPPGQVEMRAMTAWASIRAQNGDYTA